MTYDPERHHRRSIRLPEYDYAQPGAYFVTLVTHQRQCLFGEIVDGEMRLNEAGRIAEQCWRAIPVHFPHVELDAFVIMPNHVHGILWIVDNDGGDDVGAKNLSPLRSPQLSPLRSRQSSPPRLPQSPPLPPRGTSKTIGSVVRGFKIGVTKWFRQNTSVSTVWQRNYYEHIIRDEDEWSRIRQYILDNPANWATDSDNPNCELRKAQTAPGGQAVNA